MKKLFRIVIVLVVLLIVAGLLAIYFIGNIVKTGVEKVGPVVTKVPVKLDSASISVFSGSGELKGFVLGNPEGFKSPQAIKVGTVSLSLEPGSVMKEKKHIRSIKVEGPEISYETDLKGSNLQKILDNISSGESQEKKPGEKKDEGSKTKLQVDEFVITGGKISVGATMLGSATLPLPEIRLTNLGDGPDGITPIELSEKVMRAVLEGTIKAVAGGVGKIGTDATDTLKKGASGIGDLFKKKQ